MIHIHGIWAPIQIFSILKCNKEKLNCVIHPHGMFLPEALGSGGKLKYFFKLFSLYVLQKILNTNVNFISITNQETIAIKKYFPEAKVNKISIQFLLKFLKLKKRSKKKICIFWKNSST